MKTIELQVEVREGVGKRLVKAVRREGKIPANLYGRGIDPTPLAVTKKAFFDATHTKAGANALISLKIQGAKTKKDTTCLIKEVQQNPVTDAIVHVDFAAVSLTEKIRVNVSIVVRDAENSHGVKEGGILDVVHHEIEVECLPTDIPDRIEVSGKDLKIGDTVHVKELTLPSGVVPILEGDEVVVALHPPRKEEEVVALPAAEGATEPELIEKGKKEKPEEAAEAAPAKPEKAEKPEKK
jgi:large subunit ribosomal protein L25